MRTINPSYGPSTALGGFYFPVSNQEATNLQEGAALRLQRISRDFLEKKHFFKDNLKATLKPFFSKKKITAICDFAWNPTKAPDPQASVSLSFVNKTIHLYTVLKNNKNTAEGSFKVYRPALYTTCNPSQKIFSSVEKSIAFIKKTDDLSKKDQERLDEQLIREIQILQEISDLIKTNSLSEVYIPSPLKKIEEKIYVQNWYPSDLKKAVKNKSVYLSFNPMDPKKFFGVKDALSCLRDIGKTLDQLHPLGYVHRDVKPSNMLVSHEQGKLIGILTDFGSATQKSGWDPLNIPSEYSFWGPLEMCNISTPLGDLYGLCSSVILLLSPKTTDQDLAAIRNEIIYSLVSQDPSTDPLQTKFNLPFEKEFRLVCLQSVLALFHILKNDAKIDISTTFQNCRALKEHSKLSDIKLSICLLQDLAQTYKSFFTHEKIAHAINHASEIIIKKDHASFTMKDLIEKITTSISSLDEQEAKQQNTNLHTETKDSTETEDSTDTEDSIGELLFGKNSMCAIC